MNDSTIVPSKRLKYRGDLFVDGARHDENEIVALNDMGVEFHPRNA